MAKTVAYFYDPDVGNFHYGAGRGRDREGGGGTPGEHPLTLPFLSLWLQEPGTP